MKESNIRRMFLEPTFWMSHYPAGIVQIHRERNGHGCRWSDTLLAYLSHVSVVHRCIKVPISRQMHTHDTIYRNSKRLYSPLTCILHGFMRFFPFSFMSIHSIPEPSDKGTCFQSLTVQWQCWWTSMRYKVCAVHWKTALSPEKQPFILILIWDLFKPAWIYETGVFI